MSTETHLKLVGAFAVRRDGRDWPAAEVGSRKSRRLLALLAVERGRLVATDRVVEALWGPAPPRRPAENVATLVSRLRTTLGAEVVAGGRGGYRLGTGVGVDVHDAAVMVARADRWAAGQDAVLALVTARQVLGMLGHGVVLEDEPDSPWAEPARLLQTGLLRRARHVACEAALRLGDLAAARAAAEEAVRADPLDEPAYRLAMRAHAAAGDASGAMTVYARLRDVLADNLGVDPSPATRDLRAALLRRRRPEPVRSGSLA